MVPYDLTLSQAYTIAGALFFLWTDKPTMSVVYVLLCMAGYLDTTLQPLFVLAMAFSLLILKPRSIK